MQIAAAARNRSYRPIQTDPATIAVSLGAISVWQMTIF